MLYKDKTLILYRSDLRKVYSKVVLESVHVSMFDSSLQELIRKAYFVFFVDDGKEIVLKNRYGVKGIITDVKVYES